MFINLVLYQRVFIYRFKPASITFLFYILFELLDVEHGTPISQLHDFSIYFINDLSFCCCICYLLFHMLFPSISMTVIDYTCITSVSEYS